MLEKLSAEGQALLLVHENKASSIEKIRSSIFSRSQYSSEEPGLSSIDRHSENLIDRHSENLPKCPQDESDHIREASRIFCTSTAGTLGTSMYRSEGNASERGGTSSAARACHLGGSLLAQVNEALVSKPSASSNVVF